MRHDCRDDLQRHGEHRRQQSGAVLVDEHTGSTCGRVDRPDDGDDHLCRPGVQRKLQSYSVDVPGDRRHLEEDVETLRAVRCMGWSTPQGQR